MQLAVVAASPHSPRGPPFASLFLTLQRFKAILICFRGMAAGVGEASAVLQVFTTGASITKYLLDYAKGVRAAEKNIIELGEEIFQTTGTLRDLQRLIEENRNTPHWDEYGERGAEKCAADCAAVIEKLRKILYRSQNLPIPDDSTLLPPVPENLSLFNKAKWPWLV